MESKRATIFITAHVGPWQVAPLVTKKFGFIINAIYAPESNPTCRTSCWICASPLAKADTR